MPEYDARLLLHTETLAAWDVQCPGTCRDKSSEELAPGTRFVFPYRGVYKYWVGGQRHVVEANQMAVLNDDQPYRVSHPLAGGDATLTIGLDPATLLEVTPADYRSRGDRPALNRSVLRIDASTQVFAAQLRQRLAHGSIDRMESEALTLQLVRQALGNNPSGDARRSSSSRPAKMVDRVRLMLAEDPWRRWTLAEIAREVSVTPVYLTDTFRRIEGIPLYRYHLRLRLAVALNALAERDDLTALAVELGFHSHSHFSSAFKKTFGYTPSEFKRSVAYVHGQGASALGLFPKELDSTALYVSRSVIDSGHTVRDTPKVLATTIS